MQLVPMVVVILMVVGPVAGGTRDDMLNAMQQLMTGDDLYFHQEWLTMLDECMGSYSADLPGITVRRAFVRWLIRI